MSKSLNDAFLRAYSKEKAAEAQRKSAEQKTVPAPSQPSYDEYIVRFDTATCAVPEPHFFIQRPEKVSVSESLETLSQRPAPRRLAASQSAALAQSEAERVRSEIASQMSQASSWEDPQIDAFSGGFPMISPFHQRVQPPHIFAQETRPSQVANARQELVSALESEPPLRVATEPVEPIVATRKPLDKEFIRNETASVERQVHEFSADPKGFDPETKASPAVVRPPQLEPLAMPVQLESAPTPPPTQAEVSAPQLPSAERVSIHAGKGEIFRLDRPSYSSSIADDSPLSDSGDLSSIIGSLSESHTYFEIETSRVTNHAKRHQVNSLEGELRRAKVRIFNPVWEVDSFQWPEICCELLEQRATSMDKVAQNLVAACQEGLQVLAVTSPQSGAGRTTVACCLAKLAGSRGLNVAIVDGDIENPTLSFQTNLDVESDWKMALFNEIPLEEIAVHSIDDQVTLVPLIQPIDNSEMSISDNRIESMLLELSDSFDLVIVDMGHMDSPRNLVTSLGERGVISAVVAVVDHRTSTKEQIELCLRRIRRTGVASIGLIENFAA